MIIFVDSIRNLEFWKLTSLCCDEIEQMRLLQYKNLSKEQGALHAENDFYHYLKASFFAVGGLYCINEDHNRYISTVRFDPYQDGLLLNALITDPDMRRKGYAEDLLRSAFTHIGAKRIYSHIHVRNLPSKFLHEKLGFKQIHDFARMLNGSVRNDHVTYIKNL